MSRETISKDIESLTSIWKFEQEAISDSVPIVVVIVLVSVDMLACRLLCPPRTKRNPG